MTTPSKPCMPPSNDRKRSVLPWLVKSSDTLKSSIRSPIERVYSMLASNVRRCWWKPSNASHQPVCYGWLSFFCSSLSSSSWLFHLRNSASRLFFSLLFFSFLVARCNLTLIHFIAIKVIPSVIRLSYSNDIHKESFSRMIPSLMHLAGKVLGKFFLAMESLRYIPEEIIEMIFREYLRSISSLSIITEKDLTRIVLLLSDYHADLFCTSFCYSLVNHLNLLTAQFYLHLFKRTQIHLSQLDFSNAVDRFTNDEKAQLLNVIGQMESIEYLRLTHNRLDDDDIRLLTASHRITSKALCHLHSLHLQGKNVRLDRLVNKDTFLGNHLTSRSARFLKALASLETLYVSHLSGRVRVFVRQNQYLTSISHVDRRNRLLSKNSTISTNVLARRPATCGPRSPMSDGLPKFLNFNRRRILPLIIIFVRPRDLYSHRSLRCLDRKRRRIDHDESMPLLKLVRICTSCRPITSSKVTAKKGETIDQTKVLIDPRQANDLLSCYLW